MKWMVVSKRNDKCRGAKFRWTLNQYESLKNACQNASHEWTRRLNRAWRTTDEEDEEEHHEDQEKDEEEDEEDEKDEADEEDKTEDEQDQARLG